MVRELRGHVSAVHAVVFNRDGNNIISGGLDGCMRIWDLPKQTCILALNLRSGPLNAIAISRDGGILATCTESSTGEQKGASIQVNCKTVLLPLSSLRSYRPPFLSDLVCAFLLSPRVAADYGCCEVCVRGW
jgi:WD40 repeat protein